MTLKSFSVLFIFIFFNSSIQANTLNPSRIQENQEKFYERQRQQQEIDNKLNENLSSQVGSEVPISTQPIEKKGRIILEDIDIDFDGKKFFIDFDDITKDYINKPISNVDVYNLIRIMTGKLYDEGFSTSAIVIAEPAIVNKVLKLKIKWGYLETTTINGNLPEGFREYTLIKSAMPLLRYGIINMHAIDQAIENMNNGFKIAKLKVLPSENYGYSIIDFNVDYHRTPKLSLRVDNTAQSDDYTPYRYLGNASIGDVLLVNDMLGFGGNFKDYSDKERMEYGLNANYSVPIGYAKLSLSVNYSKSETPFHIADVNFPYLSETATYAAKIATNVWRNSKGKMGVYTELKTKDTKTFFDEIMLEQNSLNYSDVTVGFDVLYKFGADSLYTDLSFTRGIHSNNGNYAAFNDEGAFDWVKRFNGSISYNHPFIETNFNLRSQLGFQYSTQSLVSNYQLTLGDEYTIRGLNSNSALNGDSGGYLNNTIEYTFNKNVYNTYFSISPFVGVDAGYLRNNSIKSNISLASISTGARFNFSKVDLSLGYGQVIASTQKLIPNGIFYLNGGVSF